MHHASVHNKGEAVILVHGVALQALADNGPESMPIVGGVLTPPHLSHLGISNTVGSLAILLACQVAVLALEAISESIVASPCPSQANLSQARQMWSEGYG